MADYFKPSPVRGKSGDRPLTDIPYALTDMLASALRGTVKATGGMPGDVEGLGRMGINALGGNVDKETILPTTEDVGNWMWKGTNNPTAEKLGEFLPAPTGVSALTKGAKTTAAALRRTVSAEAPGAMNTGRREALKKIGSIGTRVAATALAPHLLSKVMTEAPLATKAAEGAVAKAAASEAAKVAAHAWNPAEVLAFTKHTRKELGFDGDFVSPETMEQVAKHFKNPQELKNFDEWSKYWQGGDPIDFLPNFKPGFDKAAADAAWQADTDALRLKHGIPERYWDTPGFDRAKLDPYYTEADKLAYKHFPPEALSDEMKAYDKGSEWLDKNVPWEELEKVWKTVKPGQVPPEWARNGVTPHMIADRMSNPEYIGDGANTITGSIAGDRMTWEEFNQTKMMEDFKSRK